MCCSFLKASVGPIPSIGSTLMVGAEAWRDGIRQLGPLQHHKVILETYSLELVNLWRDRETHPSEVHPSLDLRILLILGGPYEEISKYYSSFVF
jgi:hypothetical protein